MASAIHRLSAAALFSAIAGSGFVALAQQPPKPADTPEAKPQAPDKVVVNGVIPDVSTQIDRQVYDIAHDPQAQSGSASDILAKIPSVTVTANGLVQLLGSLPATVMIDGKPLPNQQNRPDLKNLPASEIDRIEVMTNPSAQFSAQGAGGIVNIITRRTHGPGLKGSMVASADSFGAAQLSASPTWTVGKWSVGGTIAYNRSAQVRENLRQLQLSDGAAPVSRFEARREEQEGDNPNANLRATYKPTDDQTFSASLGGFGNDYAVHTRTRTTSSDPAFLAYVEANETKSRLQGANASLDYEWRGKSDSESLKASASTNGYDWKTRRDFIDNFDDASRPPAGFRTTTRYRNQTSAVTIDSQKPLLEKQMLSTGVAWNRDERDDMQASVRLTNDPSLPPDFQHASGGHRDVLAAYATFQFPMGKWTFLPGLRVETETHDIDASADAGRRDTELFPSLHISRDLSRDLKLKLSYAARTARPEIGNFDPTIVYYTATTASAGNPDLKPARIDSYEARLDYRLSRQNFNVTFYDRRTDEAVSSSVTLIGDGVRLTGLVNSGSILDRGAEASMRGPLGDSWKYVVTANLFDRKADRLDQGGLRRESQFSYRGNARIEYHRRNAAGEDADQVELVVYYSGPQTYFQTEMTSYLSGNLTWRRPLTKKLALVLDVNDLFVGAASRSRYLAPGFSDETREIGQGPRVKLSLTYKLG